MKEVFPVNFSQDLIVHKKGNKLARYSMFPVVQKVDDSKIVFDFRVLGLKRSIK